MLEDNDKRTFKKIVKVLKLPIDIYDDLDKEYQNKLHCYRGHYLEAQRHLDRDRCFLYFLYFLLPFYTSVKLNLYFLPLELFIIYKSSAPS